MTIKNLMLSSMLILGFSNALYAETFKIQVELQDITISQVTGSKKIVKTSQIDFNQMEDLYKTVKLSRWGVGIGASIYGNDGSVFGWLPIYPKDIRVKMDKNDFLRLNENGYIELISPLTYDEIWLGLQYKVNNKYICGGIRLNKKKIKNGTNDNKIICSHEEKIPLEYKYKDMNFSMNLGVSLDDDTYIYTREIGTNLSLGEIGKEIARQILICKMEMIDAKNAQKFSCNFNSDKLNNLLIKNSIFVNNRQKDQETEIIISKFEVLTDVHNSFGGEYRNQLDLFDENDEKVVTIFFNNKPNSYNLILNERF